MALALCRSSTSDSMTDALLALEDLDPELARKEARAKYMRFWRSVQAGCASTPVEIIEKAKALRAEKQPLTFLFEDYLQSKGDWGVSSHLVMLRQRVTNSESDLYRTYSARELEDLYGESDAAELISRKLKEGNWQWHPEWPNVERYRLFKCFAKAETRRQEDSQTSRELQMSTQVDQAGAAVLAGENFSNFKLMGLHRNKSGTEPKVLPKPRPPKKDVDPLVALRSKVKAKVRQVAQWTMDCSSWPGTLRTGGVTGTTLQALVNGFEDQTT